MNGSELNGMLTAFGLLVVFLVRKFTRWWVGSRVGWSVDKSDCWLRGI